jgi:hypothetical protein
MPKIFSGLTSATPEKLLLDAGAFFKNYDVTTDTFDTAVLAGKLLGATQGGGNYSAIPTIRPIEIDGAKGKVKGLETVDEWVVTIVSNIKEISEDVIMSALGPATAVDGPTGYRKITGNATIALTDYIDNITWVGRLSGSETPVIIQVLNAMSSGGLSLNMADKAEGIIPITFEGHFDPDLLEEPPFAVYYPDVAVV